MIRLLTIAEGDPDSTVASFSGISKSLIDALRRAHCDVSTGDADLYGLEKWIGAATTFAPNRRRWSVRFHSGAIPHALRSHAAVRAVRDAPEHDAILQIGATFTTAGQGTKPRFLYCDSNIRMAQRGAATGYSWASALSHSEIEAVAAREHAVYTDAAAIFTLSEYLRECFINDFGISPDRVFAVGAAPNFELADFQPLDAALDPERPPTVLFVGAQFERKGGDVLLAAFALVRQSLPNARLLIVGPRTLLVNEPGVEYLGFLRKDVPAERERLVRAYESADVFCLPTRYEPFGIAFLEAMRFGIPCIGTDVWAVPEMVQNGTTGFTVPPNDAAATASALLRVLRDPPLAAQMGEAGRKLVNGKYSWDLVAKRIVDVISERVDGAGG